MWWSVRLKKALLLLMVARERQKLHGLRSIEYVGIFHDPLCIHDEICRT